MSVSVDQRLSGVPGDPLETFVTLSTGVSPVDVPMTAYQVRITTSGLGGGDGLNALPMSDLIPGKRVLVTLVTLSDPSDSILFNPSGGIFQGDTEVSGLALNAEGEFAFLEFRGTHWELLSTTGDVS